MRSPARNFRLAAACLTLSGCISHWEIQPVAPAAAVVGAAAGGDYRVTLKSGARVTLHDVSVARDTLFGVRTADAVPDRDSQLAIPVTDIWTIEARTTNVAASVGVGVAATILALYLFVRYGGGIPVGD